MEPKEVSATHLSNERITAGSIEDVEKGLPHCAQLFADTIANRMPVASYRLSFYHRTDTKLINKGRTVRSRKRQRTIPLKRKAEEFEVTTIGKSKKLFCEHNPTNRKPGHNQEWQHSVKTVGLKDLRGVQRRNPIYRPNF